MIGRVLRRFRTSLTAKTYSLNVFGRYSGNMRSSILSSLCFNQDVSPVPGEEEDEEELTPVG
jgi:hypothetical protein